MEKQLSNRNFIDRAFALKKSLKQKIAPLRCQKKEPFLLIVEPYDNIVNNNAWLMNLSEEIFDKINKENQYFQKSHNTPMYVALFSDNKSSTEITSAVTGELTMLVNKFSNPLYTANSLIDIKLEQNKIEQEKKEKEEQERKEKEKKKKLINVLKQIAEVVKNFDEKQFIKDDEVRKVASTKEEHDFVFKSIILLGALTDHNITIKYNGLHFNEDQMFKMFKEGLKPKDVTIFDKTTKQIYFENNNLFIVADRKKALNTLISLYILRFQIFETEKIFSNLLECCEESFKNLLFNNDKMVVVKQTEESNPYVLKLPKETVDEVNESDDINNEEVNNINTQEDIEDAEDAEDTKTINADTLSKEAEANEDDVFEEIKQKITNTFKRKYKIAVKHFVESQEAKKIKEGFVESEKIEDSYIKKQIRMSIVFGLLSYNSVQFDCGYNYPLKVDKLIDLLSSGIKPVNINTYYSTDFVELLCNFGYYNITTRKENILNTIFTILCINNNCNNIEYILSKLKNDEPEVFGRIDYLVSLPDNELVHSKDEYLSFFKKLFEFKVH